MPETKVIMPQMGESIFEGTLTKWLKKPGDKVQRDEPLFEISTDKVDSEIPSPAAGTLQEILVKEGQTVQINTVVAVIGDGAAKQPAAKPQESPAAKPQESQPASGPKPQTQQTPTPEAPTTAAESIETEDEAGDTGRVPSSPLVRRIAK